MPHRSPPACPAVNRTASFPPTGRLRAAPYVGGRPRRTIRLLEAGLPDRPSRDLEPKRPVSRQSPASARKPPRSEAGPDMHPTPRPRARPAREAIRHTPFVPCPSPGNAPRRVSRIVATGVVRRMHRKPATVARASFAGRERPPLRDRLGLPLSGMNSDGPRLSTGRAPRAPAGLRKSCRNSGERAAFGGSVPRRPAPPSSETRRSRRSCGHG